MSRLALAAVYLRRMADGRHLVAVERDGASQGDPAYVTLPPAWQEHEFFDGRKKDYPTDPGFEFGDKVNLILEHPEES